MTDIRAQWVDRLAGRDPYDALMSPRLPKWARSTMRRRQAAIQLRRRVPVELGPVLGITPFIMAKSVACFLSASARAAASPERDLDIETLVSLLHETGGCLGAGRWGYEFDVQTRWAFYPAGSPNLIVTAFAARALAEAGLALNRTDFIRESVEAARFVSEFLYVDAATPRIRYVPGSENLVHNANLLGAACLVTGGILDEDDRMVAQARAACTTSLRAQRSDGSWPYGAEPGLEWEDSFHTAYNLDALLTLWLASGDSEIESALRRGAHYWAQTFFGPNGEPFFGPVHHLPYDIHSAGTALDVGSRLARHGLCDGELIERIAGWTSRNLINATGSATYARVWRMGTDRRHFVRWGDAHHALGVASLEVLRSDSPLPLEAALNKPAHCGDGS